MDTATRRKLLQTGLAAALLAAGGMPVAAGARSGGRLRVGLSGAPARHLWAPHLGFGVFQSLTGAGLLFDTLTEIAPDGLLQGGLATSWAPSRGGLIWTFELNPEARFHDGRGLSAEDVVASLDLHLNPTAPGFGLRSLVDRMTILSSHSLRLTLHEPNPDFPYLLSDPVLLIGPAEGLSRAFVEGCGTGPYRLAEFDGSRLLAERVRGHHQADTESWFETVEVLVLPEAQTRASALSEGRVDVVDRIPPTLLRRLQQFRESDVLELPATEFVQISAGQACPLDVQSDLISGLRLGIDRERLAGMGCFHPMPSSRASAVDRARARARLSAFANAPVRVAMDSEIGEDGARLVGALASQMRDLGLTPTLAAGETPAHLHVARRSMRPTPDWTRHAARLGGAEAGYSGSAQSWAESGARSEHLARFTETGPCFLPVVADANLVVSAPICRPETTGEGWDLAHARLARRWWRG